MTTEEHLGEEIKILRRKMRELEQEIELLKLRLEEKNDLIELMQERITKSVRIPFEGTTT